MLKFGLFSAARGKRQILSDCTSQHLKRIHLQLCKVTMQNPEYVGQATVLIQEKKDRALL